MSISMEDEPVRLKRVRLVPTVGVVVFDSARANVLLVEHLAGASHKNGVIGFPAGKFESGEHGAQTAVRELKEETGLICVQEHMLYLKSYEAYVEKKSEIVFSPFFVFVCTEFEGELRTSQETRPFWHPVSTLDELRLLPNVSAAVLLAQESFMISEL